MSEENKREKERFGRYLILDHLVDGGMAKICRARFLGEQADKIVAIKMVQPQYSSDESFKTMFEDEIKVTFALLHPNIVQTYDYGMHNKQLYVAMEYVDGQNLKEYLDKLKERKFVFPVEISTYIITQVCQGLNYAHTLTDKLSGKEANIIHRDISPHNIMLTFDGAVKVIDFGIAKAESNSESTQAGTIKGKLSYLAPEYLDGLDLDPRYDEFAVGITLWEMLCSRKLFKANNDLAVLKKIQECKIPAPSSINPNVPKELDEIVLKALSKDRNNRYENLDQLNRALMKFLYSHYPDFNATDLAYFAKELFKDEIKKDREKLFEYGKIDLRPYLDDLKSEQSGSSSSGSNNSSSSAKTNIKKEQVLDFGFEDESATKTKTKAKGTRKIARPEDLLKKSGSTPNVMEEIEKNQNATLEVGATKSRALKTRTNVDSGKTSIKRNATKTKTKAKKPAGDATRIRKKKKESSSKGLLYAVVFAAVAGVGFTQFKDKFITKKIEATVTDVDVAETAEDIEVEPNTRTPSDDNSDSNSINQDSKVLLKNFDKYNQTVFVNGTQSKVDYMGQVDVPYGKEITIRIESVGRKHFVSTQNFDGEGLTSLEVPDMPYQSYGYLKTSRLCISGTLYFTMFGEERVEKLPISSSAGIPLEAKNWEVHYQREGESIRHKVTFDVAEDESVDFCKKIF
jgi:serine/threonine-protein kinase